MPNRWSAIDRSTHATRFGGKPLAAAGLATFLLQLAAGPAFGAPAASHPAQPAFGAEMFCVSDSGLACFEAATMRRRWRMLRGNYTFEPLITDSVVLAGSSTGLHALRASDGSPHWKWNSGRETASPAVHGGTVYAAGRAGRLAAIDLDSGAVTWRRRLEGRLYTPAVTDSRLFAGARDGVLYALDRKTGKTLWRYELATELVSRPVAVRGGVVVTTFGGAALMLNGSGELRWSKSDRAPSFSPTVAGEMLLFGGMDGKLRARHRRSGDLLWRCQLPGRLSIPASVRGSRVAVATPGGELVVIDAGTGSVLGRAELPAPPLGRPVPLENAVWRVFFREAGEVAWTDAAPE